MNTNLRVIGFDADDTLWINEPFFRDSENEFFKLLGEFESAENINKVLYKTEMQNLALYGYGTKSFMLSMIETGLLITNHKITNQQISRIIEIGKKQIEKPVELLDNIENVLIELSKNYKL
ncbi:MAG: HAD family hydrolase, partial [Salinivirgaceae bacterium]|nr:HAD family hydrolase [Salinivirgaceae bacterium]